MKSGFKYSDLQQEYHRDARAFHPRSKLTTNGLRAEVGFPRNLADGNDGQIPDHHETRPFRLSPLIVYSMSNEKGIPFPGIKSALKPRRAQSANEDFQRLHG